MKKRVLAVDLEGIPTDDPIGTCSVNDEMLCFQVLDTMSIHRRRDARSIQPDLWAAMARVERV